MVDFIVFLVLIFYRFGILFLGCYGGLRGDVDFISLNINSFYLFFGRVWSELFLEVEGFFLFWSFGLCWFSIWVI